MPKETLEDARIVGVIPPPGLRGFSAREVSDATSLETGPETYTQQHFREEVDVNTIMRRFGVTQELPLGPATGIYGDFTGITDYESAVERIEGARNAFMQLPAEVRERFDNDPGKLIAAAEVMPPEEFEALFSGDSGGVETPPPGEVVE